MLINERFNDFRFRSFFIEKEMICNYLVIFFQASSSGWISLTIDEGIAKFTKEFSEPNTLDLSEIFDDYAYPVQDATELSCYKGKKLINIYEHRIKGIEEGCIGIYFECEDCGFTVLESDGCLSITHGFYENFQEETHLVKL